MFLPGKILSMNLELKELFKNIYFTKIYIFEYIKLSLWPCLFQSKN